MTGLNAPKQVWFGALAIGIACLVWGGAGLADGAHVRTDLNAKDLARVRKIVAPTTDFSKAERFENKSGGAATFVNIADGNAFSHFSQNLSFADQGRFNLGDALFRKLWVSAPASTLASDGLGPLFNARGCQSCHLKDGRGRPPADINEKAVSMFLRLSVPARSADEESLLSSFKASVLPEPNYGTQLQNFAVPGLAAEGEMTIDYEDITVTLADGEIVHLRAPKYGIADPAYGPVSADIMLSPRVAPQMIALGLLEAVPAEDILALADPDDKDGDGISGRPNWAWGRVQDSLQLGRFGWKAGVPNIRTQSALAFAGDIGISTPLVDASYGDCMKTQSACFDLPTGVQKHLGDTEAPDPVLDLVTFYAQNLAVPERRNSDAAEVLQGKKVFYETGCAACHQPKFVTSRKAENPDQRFQLIWPYTDMLLHDMGAGLADDRPEGAADGYEWRTPPLWGVGLTETVSGHTQFLHDGRARNLLEAVLWHGGEAEAARDKVVAMGGDDRRSLIAFLESL